MRHIPGELIGDTRPLRAGLTLCGRLCYHVLPNVVEERSEVTAPDVCRVCFKAAERLAMDRPSPPVPSRSDEGDQQQGRRK